MELTLNEKISLASTNAKQLRSQELNIEVKNLRSVANITPNGAIIRIKVFAKNTEMQFYTANSLDLKLKKVDFETAKANQFYGLN